MSDLAEQLIVGMRDYGVELDFAGKLLNVHPELLKVQFLASLRGFTFSNLDAHLGLQQLKQQRDYFLIYHDEVNLRQKIACVHHGAYSDYQAELLDAVIINLKAIEPQTQIRLLLPKNLETYVNGDHLKLLQLKGEMREGSECPIPIYNESDLDNESFWNSFRGFNT